MNAASISRAVSILLIAEALAAAASACSSGTTAPPTDAGTIDAPNDAPDAVAPHDAEPDAPPIWLRHWNLADQTRWAHEDMGWKLAIGDGWVASHGRCNMGRMPVSRPENYCAAGNLHIFRPNGGGEWELSAAVELLADEVSVGAAALGERLVIADMWGLVVVDPLPHAAVLAEVALPFGDSLAATDDLIVLGVPYDSLAHGEDGEPPDGWFYTIDVAGNEFGAPVGWPAPRLADTSAEWLNNGTFGCGVAVTSERIYIASSDRDFDGSWACDAWGQVEVYLRTTGGPVPEMTIGSSLAGDALQPTIAAWGNSLLVASRSGAVLLRRRDDTWSVWATLEPPGWRGPDGELVHPFPDRSDQSVALGDEYALFSSECLGCPDDPTYVYGRDGETWCLQGTLPHSESVRVRGRLALIGDPEPAFPGLGTDERDALNWYDYSSLDLYELPAPRCPAE